MKNVKVNPVTGHLPVTDSLLAKVALSTDGFVIITDHLNHIIWINDSFTKISGYTFEEVKGKTPFEFLCGPNTNSEAVQSINEAIEIGESRKVDLLLYTK